jgi:hypothetical protein
MNTRLRIVARVWRTVSRPCGCFGGDHLVVVAPQATVLDQVGGMLVVRLGGYEPPDVEHQGGVLEQLPLVGAEAVARPGGRESGG